MTTHSPEQILALLKAAITDAPMFGYLESRTEEQLRWVARVDALLKFAGNIRASVAFDLAKLAIGSSNFDEGKLLQPLYDAYYLTELSVPSALQGAFIPPGDTWNGYAALVRILQDECDSLLIVDPYISADIFPEFMPHASARSGVRILTTKQTKLHEALLASAEKWKQTHPLPTESVEVRYAETAALHDRLLIIDNKEAWLVSQSIKDIAKRSPASVTRADAEIAIMKAQFYDALWSTSTPI